MITNHLKHWLTKPLQTIPTKFVVAILVVALIGFIDASYLTVKHYAGVIPPCSVGGCEQVLTSEYAVLWGIPVALTGALFYLIVMIGAFAYLESKHHALLRWALLMTIPGFAFTLYLFVLQAAVIDSFCLYCLGSAATSTSLFVLAIYAFSKYSQKESLM